MVEEVACVGEPPDSPSDDGTGTAKPSIKPTKVITTNLTITEDEKSTPAMHICKVIRYGLCRIEKQKQLPKHPCRGCISTVRQIIGCVSTATRDLYALSKIRALRYWSNIKKLYNKHQPVAAQFTQHIVDQLQEGLNLAKPYVVPALQQAGAATQCAIEYTLTEEFWQNICAVQRAVWLTTY